MCDSCLDQPKDPKYHFTELEPSESDIMSYWAKHFKNIGKLEAKLEELSHHDMLDSHFLSKHNPLWYGLNRKEEKLTHEEIEEMFAEFRSFLMKVHDLLGEAFELLETNED